MTRDDLETFVREEFDGLVMGNYITAEEWMDKSEEYASGKVREALDQIEASMVRAYEERGAGTEESVWGMISHIRKGLEHD